MNILFISHKVPYPPDKGEKIRAFQFIKHLSRESRIFLYSLCDNRNDLKHKDKLKEYCSSVNIYCLSTFFSSLRAVFYLFTKYPFTFAFFFSYRMKRDVKKFIRNQRIDVIFVYCSSMAQYALDFKTKCSKIIDFVDIDSDKWKDYAHFSKFPFSLIYALEASRLKTWERRINKIFDASIVTTEKEKERLGIISLSNAEKVKVIVNGVDFEYFKPRLNSIVNNAVIFTGQMDYFPNVDAVKYFCVDILPLIKKSIPDIKFYVVGRNPPAALKKICKEVVMVGFTEDIREYLAKASIYVAPFRIAHGIQNKILEAMAFGLPVVTTGKISESIKAIPEKEILVGDTPEEFAQKVIELLQNKQKRDLISRNAQEFVKKNHDWENNLLELEKILKALKDK